MLPLLTDRHMDNHDSNVTALCIFLAYMLAIDATVTAWNKVQACSQQASK